MPRRSGGRRSGGGRSFRFRSAPSPAPVNDDNKSTPPATVQSGGGSFLNRIGSAMSEGFGFGAGNGLGHRVAEAVMGPRTIRHETVVKEDAKAAPAPTANTFGGDACGIQSKTFVDCLNDNTSDISKCQFYMDMIVECKRNSGASFSAKLL